MPDGKTVEKKIYSAFTSIASKLGYSDVHGRIIATLLVKNQPLPLQDLAKETGYSSSMISLSLDFLEMLGILRRVKKRGDRKLYVEIHGDLLEGLKKAITVKIQKGIFDSLEEFELYKKEIKKIKNKGERERINHIINTLEKEINRIGKYIEELSKIELPPR